MRPEWLARFDLRGAVMRGCRLNGCVICGATSPTARCRRDADLGGAVLVEALGGRCVAGRADRRRHAMRGCAERRAAGWRT